MAATNQTADALNATFAVDGLRFEDGPGGLVRGVISTPACDGEFFLHGAQVTRWRPSGHDDVLWLSPTARYEDGKAIRGGIPICFPWFGAHVTDPGAPSHGLARTRAWELRSAHCDGDTIEVALSADIAPWACVLTASFAAELSVTLSVTNTGVTPAEFEAALHSYFAVEATEHVTIGGLESSGYIDQVAGNALRPASGEPIGFTGEVDRIYDVTSPSLASIEDGRRRIEVEGRNSRSTVVWNPASEKARALADVGENEWRRFVCVETANVRERRVRLGPGEASSVTARVRVPRR
ncbi:MAG: D-hexose-6-phosphate mutarotase [Dehalococcoidia bacterium]|nr:D-hexose-6-phosphate mutarotase [Dehalococcoidia bacterium]